MATHLHGGHFFTKCFRIYGAERGLEPPRRCRTLILRSDGYVPHHRGAESPPRPVLCRAGKLYGIERWISAGKPIVIDSSLRKTALLTAVETGFQSLVELLARHEPRQEQKGSGSRRRRRAETVGYG